MDGALTIDDNSTAPKRTVTNRCSHDVVTTLPPTKEYPGSLPFTSVNVRHLPSDTREIVVI